MARPECVVLVCDQLVPPIWLLLLHFCFCNLQLNPSEGVALTSFDQLSFVFTSISVSSLISFLFHFPLILRSILTLFISRFFYFFYNPFGIQFYCVVNFGLCLSVLVICNVYTFAVVIYFLLIPPVVNKKILFKIWSILE